MPNEEVRERFAEAEFFVCIRREGPGPRAYPVVKHPDGRIEEVTWADYESLN